MNYKTLLKDNNEMLINRLLNWNIAVFMIGLIDLITTLVWIHNGSAIEFNPIMAWVLSFGITAFILTKLLTISVYVLVLEWYRRRDKTTFSFNIGRFTVLAYLAIYLVSFITVNSALLF